jgi:hypothetical protein
MLNRCPAYVNMVMDLYITGRRGLSVARGSVNKSDGRQLWKDVTVTGRYRTRRPLHCDQY